MVWPFSKGKTSEPPNKLVFKSGADFVDYQCKFGHVDIKPKEGIVAVVLDAVAEFGVSRPVKVEEDGRQLTMLRVASEDGGFVVPAYTATGKGDRLEPGDVVIWVPVEYNKSEVERAEGVDPRFGWVGFIVAKIEPELDMNKPDFNIVCYYH